MYAPTLSKARLALVTLLLSFVLVLIATPRSNTLEQAAPALGSDIHDSFDAPRPRTMRLPAREAALSPAILPGNPEGFSIPDGTTGIPGPNFYQTSEFMFGTVAVGVIMPQCDGSIETCSETWTQTMMDQVVQQIKIGVNWWVPRMDGRVSFVIDQQRQVPTGYEPINHAQSEERLWIGDVMTHLGVQGANYVEQVYAYNNKLRQTYGTDWAFTVFVANSLSSRSGTFSNGFFSYSYVPGPFTVTTFKNGNYGINNMSAVIAHETGHIFGALDQYPGANIACTAVSGYLGLPNQNSQRGCDMDQESIMRGGLTPYIKNLIDPYALGMVGNRVSGGGNLPDPLNTTPIVTLDPVRSNTLSRNPLITGAAQDQPYLSSKGHAVTINNITSVNYRVDDGEWCDALPGDGSGAFSKVTQTFMFAPSLNPGTHKVDIRAINRVNHPSPIVSVTISVSNASSPQTW